MPLTICFLKVLHQGGTESTMVSKCTHDYLFINSIFTAIFVINTKIFCGYAKMLVFDTKNIMM